MVRALIGWVVVAGVLAGQDVGRRELVELQGRVGELAAKVLPATVGLRIAGSAGSGVIVTADGYVLTAAHVFEKPGQVVRATLWDGRVVRGRTLGRQEREDFGLVKLDEEGPWPFAPMGASEQLSSWEPCFALGHPGGVQTGRAAPLRFGNVISNRGTFIRTSCIVDRGDSGGPLFDMQGQVIGIHSRIGRATSQNYHIPIDRYRAGWDRLVAAQNWGLGEFSATAPVIGIRGSFGPRRAGGDPGSVVLKVYPGLPAADAGLEEGDRIVGISGTPVRGMDDITAFVENKEVGDEVTLEFFRQDEKRSVTFRLGRSPNAAAPPPSADMPLVSDDDEAGTSAALPLVAWMESGNEIKDAAATIVAGSHRSVVRVTSGDDHRILGTILTADGWIVTKDSELRDSAACTLADGRKLYPERIVRDPLHDLAFLKVRASDLRPVGLVIDREYLPGEWVVCQGRDERPIGVGVVSVLPRQVGLTGGFLGVTLEDLTERGGIRVTRVIPDTAAALARIQPEDVILMLDGKAMSERTELIAGLSSRSPGSAVTLRILRGDREFEVPATLGARPNEPGETPEQRNTRRRVLSDRRTGFPQVLQHDTVLDPDQCGTPLIDVSGLCIGINIARESRLSTLAVPSSLVATQLKWARGKDLGR